MASYASYDSPSLTKYLEANSYFLGTASALRLNDLQWTVKGGGICNVVERDVPEVPVVLGILGKVQFEDFAMSVPSLAWGSGSKDGVPQGQFILSAPTLPGFNLHSHFARALHLLHSLITQKQDEEVDQLDTKGVFPNPDEGLIRFTHSLLLDSSQVADPCVCDTLHFNPLPLYTDLGYLVDAMDYESELRGAELAFVRFTLSYVPGDSSALNAEVRSVSVVAPRDATRIGCQGLRSLAQYDPVFEVPM